jgi:hypothetical protein
MKDLGRTLKSVGLTRIVRREFEISAFFAYLSFPERIGTKNGF